jgi:hypothetical protein
LLHGFTGALDKVGAELGEFLVRNRGAARDRTDGIETDAAGILKLRTKPIRMWEPNARAAGLPTAAIASTWNSSGMRNSSRAIQSQISARYAR